jgi:hypothetical protein
MMMGAIVEINLHREEDVQRVDNNSDSDVEEKIGLHPSPLYVEECLGYRVGQDLGERLALAEN